MDCIGIKSVRPQQRDVQGHGGRGGLGRVAACFALDAHLHLTTPPFYPRNLSYLSANNIERCLNSGSAMLQELSHMDRITQLQNEIEQVHPASVSSLRFTSR